MSAAAATRKEIPEQVQGTIIGETLRRGEKVVVMDFFCGAGGMSCGLVRVLEGVADAMGVDVEDIATFIAVNHWDRAIETHAKNHPWVHQIQYDVTELRPNDLYAGTQQENIDDAIEHGDYVEGRARGQDHPNQVLDADKARRIRDLYQTTDHSQRSLADEFDVSKGAIQDILERKTWDHVGDEGVEG